MEIFTFIVLILWIIIPLIIVIVSHINRKHKEKELTAAQAWDIRAEARQDIREILKNIEKEAREGRTKLVVYKRLTGKQMYKLEVLGYTTKIEKNYPNKTIILWN